MREVQYLQTYYETYLMLTTIWISLYIMSIPSINASVLKLPRLSIANAGLAKLSSRRDRLKPNGCARPTLLPWWPWQAAEEGQWMPADLLPALHAPGEDEDEEAFNTMASSRGAGPAWGVGGHPMCPTGHPMCPTQGFS